MSSKLRIALVVPVLAALLPSSAAASDPPVPDADPFYRPPAALASYAPGAIIRSREVDVSLGPAPLSALGATSYQLLYRTEDPAGQPVANATTVIVPSAPNPDGGPELVSLQDAEDSLTTNCAPSYQLRIGERDNSDMQAELAAAAPSQLPAGRVLVIPDPYGPRSEFLVRGMEARATLDSIRAAERFPAARLAGGHTPAVLVGYSGGGHETMAAAELQAAYAPELNIVGAAAGGTPVGDRELYDDLDGKTGSGVVMGAMLALERADGHLGWSSLLNDHGRAVASAEEHGPGCVTPVVSGTDHVRDWTTVADPLGVARIARAIEDNALGHAPPATPTFLYVSQHDELIPLANEDKLAARYCSAGARLDYYRDPTDYQGPLGDHLEAALAGFIPRALPYLSDRLAGKPAPSTCPLGAAQAQTTTPRRCSPSGTLVLRLRVPPGLRVRRIDLRINGHRIPARRIATRRTGARSLRITVSGRPRGALSVKLRIRGREHGRARRLALSRVYRACGARRRR